MGRKNRHKSAINHSHGASIPAPVPPLNNSLTVKAAAEAGDESDDVIASRKERDDKIYEGYHNDLVKLEAEAGREYDKWLLTLAGAALAFSLNFVKDYRGAATLKNTLVVLPCLYASWVLFGSASAMILTNMLVAYSGVKKYKRIVNEMYKSYDASPDFWSRVTTKMERVLRNKCVELFNWLSWVEFIAGLATMVYFIYRNSK